MPATIAKTPAAVGAYLRQHTPPSLHDFIPGYVAHRLHAHTICHGKKADTVSRATVNRWVRAICYRYGRPVDETDAYGEGSRWRGFDRRTQLAS